MTTQEIESVVTRKGTIHTLTTERKVDLKKGHDAIVIKKSRYQLRLGHAYNNQKAVKEKHESGEREKVGVPDYLED